MHMIERSTLLAFVLALTAPQMAADPELYCGERRLGLHFYCAPPKPPAEPEVTREMSKPVAEPEAGAETAVGKIARIRETLKEYRAEAILNPTPDNLARYMQFQKEQFERASVFADQWQRTLWANADLDYSLIRPTGTYARRNWLDDRKREVARTLGRLSERYGLFYFFSSACPVCEAFAPILRDFADRHGVVVQAISMDGGESPYFPGARAERGGLARMGLQDSPVPLLVLFDTATEEVKPVGVGLLAQDELARRIFTLTQLELGKDF